MNKKINRLCVISGRELEYDGWNYYAKSAVVEYLHKICTRFKKTHFITFLERIMSNE